MKDINDLTSNIGIKKSNLRNGKKTFLSFRKTLFSLLDDENFRIPLKPNRERFNSDNEFELANQKFTNDSQICKLLLEKKKNQLEKLKIKLAKIKVAYLIINNTDNT